MVAKYWVTTTGGVADGTWSTSSTANWSLSSGGAPGAAVPTAADDVYFDQYYFSTITMTGALVCKSLTIIYGYTFNAGTSPTLTVGTSGSGGQSSIDISPYSWNMASTITFSNTAYDTIVYNLPSTLESNITVAVGTRGFYLANSINMGVTRTFTLTSGMLSLTADYVNAYSLTTGFFVSSGTVARTIQFYGSVIYCIGNGVVWNTVTATALTINNRTPYQMVVITPSNPTSASLTVYPGVLSEANSINFDFAGGDSGSTLTFLNQASNSCFNANFSGFSGTWAAVSTATIYGSLIISTTITSTLGTGVLTFAGTTTSLNLLGASTFYIQTSSGGQTQGCFLGFSINFNSTTGYWTINYDFNQQTGKTVTITNGIVDTGFAMKNYWDWWTYFGGWPAYPGTSGGGWIMITGTGSLYNWSVTNLPFTYTSGILKLYGTFYTTGAFTHTAGTLNLYNAEPTYGYAQLNSFTVGTFTSANANVRAIVWGTPITCVGSGVVWNTNTVTSLTMTVTYSLPIVNINNASSNAATVYPGIWAEASSISFIFNSSGYSGYSYTLTLLNQPGNTARDIDLTNFIGTWTATSTCIIYGSFYMGPYVTTTASASIATFAGTSNINTKSITLNSSPVRFPMTFNSANSSYYISGLTLDASHALVVTNGTIDLTSSPGLVALLFTVNGGTVSLTNVNIIAPFTYTSGTLNLYGSFLCTGTFTHTAGTLDMTNIGGMSVGTFISNSGSTRTIIWGGSGIVCTGSSTVWQTTTLTGLTMNVTYALPKVYINNATVNPVGVYPGILPEATSISFIFNSSYVSYTLTFLNTASHSARDVDMQNFYGIWAATSTCTIYGNFYLGAGPYDGYSRLFQMTTSSNAMTLAGTGLNGNKYIATNGVSIPFPIIFNGVGSYWYTGNQFNVDLSHSMTITNGTLDGSALSGPGITASSFIVNGGTVTLIYMWISCAFTHTSGTVNINGTNFEMLGGTAALGTYTFTAGTLNINTNMYVNIFTSNVGNVRTISFASGCAMYIQPPTTLNTPVGGTLWNTTTTTSLTISGTDPRVYIFTDSATTTTVAPGILSDANSISFSINGNGSLLFLNVASHTARDVDMSSFTGNWQATSTCTIYGSLNLSPSVTLTSSASVMTFAGTGNRGNKYITTNSLTLPFPITFNGVGSYWYIDYLIVPGRALIFTNGTLDFSSGTWYYTPVSTASSITVNGGTFTLAYAGFTNVPTFTHTSGTLNIVAFSDFTGSAYTFTAGTLNVQANMIVNTFSSNNSNTRTIAFTTGTQIQCVGLANGTFWDTTTVTGLTVSGSNPLVVINPGASVTALTVSSGPLSEANSISFTINSAQGNTYNVTFLNTAGHTARDVDFSGFGAGGWIGGAGGTIYGSFAGGSGQATISSASTMTFAGSVTKTKSITPNGVGFDFPVVFNSTTSTWVFYGAFSLGATRTLTHTNGTIDLNSYILATGSYATGSGTKNIIFNAGVINCYTDGATAFNNANPSGFTTSIGSSWPGLGGIALTGATSQTFVGGNTSYAGVIYMSVPTATINGNNSFAQLYANSNGTINITGNNSFGSVDCTSPYYHTYNITAGTTQTFTGTALTVPITTNGIQWVADGNYFIKNANIKSTVTGTQITITKTFSVNAVGYNLTLQDIAFTPGPATDGSTPYVWYLGSNAVNNGNVSGGLYQDSNVIVYQITNLSTRTWTVPRDWNSNFNTIHLIGGGGGGASGVNGSGFLGLNYHYSGGGGGGGGYTKVTNYAAVPNSTVYLQVGAGGTGGTSGSPNATIGGATTWAYSAYIAFGGGGAYGGTQPGGYGGIGSTYNGGTGGSANGTVTSASEGGSGGGGAGGVNGIGGSGAAGFVFYGGGGGGGNSGGSDGISGLAVYNQAGGTGGSYGGGGGGNNSAGTGGGSGGTYNASAGSSGVNGGGGGGGSGTTSGASGSSGLDILRTIGSGGGAGGNGANSSSNSATGGLYGGGGAGSNILSNGSTANGGNGAQGIIVITYSLGSNNMFSMF